MNNGVKNVSMICFLTVSVFSALLITACSNGTNSGTSKTANLKAGEKQGEEGKKPSVLGKIERNRLPVQTRAILKRPVQNVYRASAIMDAHKDVELLASVGETVATVEKLAGDIVEKGETVARLSAPQLEFQLQKAQISFRDANRLHQASSTLFRKKHIAKDRFLESKIKLEQADLSLKDIQQQVSALTITAPFSGRIVYNDLQMGAHRSSFKTRAPIRVVDDKILQGEFSLPISYRANVQKDLEIQLLSRGVAETATVSRMSPVVDKNTGTILVYFRIDNQNQNFLAGERVSLEIPLSKATERLVLPPNSLVFEGNSPFVYVARTPTKDEVEADLEQVFSVGSGMASSSSVTPPTAKGSNLATEKSASAGVEDSLEQVDDVDRKKRDELRLLITEIPRAQKIPVEIDQLPTGEYALKEGQSGEATSLDAGSKLIVIGLYQMADSAKLKVVERF